MSVASTAGFRPQGAVVKKKVDDRIKLLIEDVAHTKHRGLILLVGDRAKDQIVNLHTMVSRATHNAKVNVLWCMKEDPDFGSTGRKKQERHARMEVKSGLATESTKEAFQNFLNQTNIRFCKYKETHKILGQTYGMAVLQDFEAINPNTLARTIETVKGGGLVVIVFRAMRSLRQLHTIAMDVHARYRTEAQRDVVPRFNERFLLSLTDCTTGLCIDDDLNVLPITQHMKTYGKDRHGGDYHSDLATQGRLQHEVDLLALKEKLKPSTSVGPLVHICQTMDQAKTVLSLMQSVTEKGLDTTCVVTAGRGRGKSAALGIAAAGAISQGYSNVFCTAPSPENLQTFFEFAVIALQGLGFKERVDFEVMESSSEEFSKCIIRVNVFKTHRQTIQFISATDADKFAQAELAIIDEAAALPLTLVRRMMGPYLVFLSSTVSGYEGTGRSLSMKLVAELRQNRGGTEAASAGSGSRALKELTMQDPIRYGPNDPVERWLNKLLCLEATEKAPPLQSSPHPSTCELYHISRDALFSYHPLAEELLHRIQSLLVAAHYKNQPNDLQLLSDAPGHHLFVLCSSTLQEQATAAVPDVYCVIHACEEGQISAEALTSNLSHGLRPSGDLIPYTLSQCYLEKGFAKLAGVRVVRIATHPDLQRGGYGSRALSLLKQYYGGSISLNAMTAEDKAASVRARTAAAVAGPSSGSGNDDDDDDEPLARPRREAPNLMTPLHERPYEPVDYVGVSFGLTTELFNFWRRAGFAPLYIRQGVNDITGEHSAVMVCPVQEVDISSLKREFQHRFLQLLSMPFRTMPTELALSVLSDVDTTDAQRLADLADRGDGQETRVAGVVQASFADVEAVLTPADLQRLRLSATTFLDGGNVLDLIPTVAQLYFSKKLFFCPDGTAGVVLTHAQAAVLAAVGLQRISLEELGAQPAFSRVTVQQLRAFFQKSLARIVEHFGRLQKLQAATARKAGGAKRVRDADGDDDDDKDGEEQEESREIYDKHGKLVGLSVSRKVTGKVNVDTTLLRDATTSAMSGKERVESFTGAPRRPKKMPKKHK